LDAVEQGLRDEGLVAAFGRAAVAALVNALRHGRDWDRLSIALVETGHEETRAPVTVAALTIVARGQAAASAAGDGVVAAAAARLGATLAVDSGDVLTADAKLQLEPEMAT
jgi:hypothetical protein